MSNLTIAQVRAALAEQNVTTASKMRLPELLSLLSSLSVSNEVGRYYKVSSRVGLAFTEVHADGSLSYTNRRSETRTITVEEFNDFSYLGYTKLNARELVSV